MTGVLSWLLTWTMMIVLLTVLSKTSWGRPLVYWFLWLAVLLLVVTHADEISSAFNPGALQLNG